MPKTIKRVLLALAVLLAVLLLAVGGYVGYMQFQYYRIPDHTALPAEGAASAAGPLAAGQNYTAVTYNIGFGAYGPDYSFFMDTGVMADGTKVAGKYGKAVSKQAVLDHTQGAQDVLAQLDTDFALLQEVDEDADRSYHVDQRALLTAARGGFQAVFANNFHSAYLFYPFNDPHGAVEAGLLTLSRYPVAAAERRSYPVDDSFFIKFTDLDRCFAVLRLPVAGGKELVLINSHMSAYDEGGTVRAAQLELLNSVLTEEYEKGNYVIVGGDFNHALGEAAPTAFPSGQQFPGWVFQLTDKDLAPHFSIVTAGNETAVATCRTADIPWQKGVNYTTNVDGFLVSDNVTASAENIDTDFSYSDHNPVKLTFSLNG